MLRMAIEVEILGNSENSLFGGKGGPGVAKITTDCISTGLRSRAVMTREFRDLVGWLAKRFSTALARWVRAY